MNFQEFSNAVLDKIKVNMDKNQHAEIQQIRKNNDVLLHGLTIHSGQSNIAPTIYLESFYTLYKRGMSFDNIIDKIRTVYQESLPKENIDMDFFRDYEKVKDRIVYKLIHAEKNRELLKEIPYIPFWDLAICFYYVFSSDVLGDGMIMIHNSHMETWNVNYSQLMKLAEVNTPKLFPMVFYGMNEVLKQMHVDIDLSQSGEEQLYILTNTKKMYGASVVLYPNTLRWVAEQLQGDFYVIPSSVHEVLILRADPDDDQCKEGRILHNMIVEINREQLGAEEILSDFPYFYSRKENKLTQIL